MVRILDHFDFSETEEPIEPEPETPHPASQAYARRRMASGLAGIGIVALWRLLTRKDSG